MFDQRFIVSMMPADLRTEIEEMLASDPENEDAIWWSGRSEEDFEQLAYSMMNDDYLWNVWRTVLINSIIEERKHIEAREATGQS